MPFIFVPNALQRHTVDEVADVDCRLALLNTACSNYTAVTAALMKCREYLIAV